MDDYGANNLNDALRLATGISVEEWETNRTNYQARGFEIKNTQIDGVGLPNNWGIVTGAMDSFGYDKLEVIRGANGLLTGVGNAAGTINFVRKRPTNNTQGSLSVEGGSWDAKRVQGDYSTPLTDSGRWAGRVIVAYRGPGLLAARSQQRPRSTSTAWWTASSASAPPLAVGYSYQSAHTDGNMWGALTLVNSDGTQASFGRSASTTQDWTMLGHHQPERLRRAHRRAQRSLVAEGHLQLPRAHRERQTVLRVCARRGSTPLRGEGLFGWPGKFNGNDHAHLDEVSLNGKFGALGREHELLFGVSQAEQHEHPVHVCGVAADPGFGALPAFPVRRECRCPSLQWGERGLSDTTDQRLRRALRRHAPRAHRSHQGHRRVQLRPVSPRRHRDATRSIRPRAR